MSAAALLDTLIHRRPAHSLPGHLYHDPGVHALEVEHLWQREWIFAANECELRQPGNFVTMAVGNYPLIVVRAADGEVHALHNVCRHRGSIVCETASGTTHRRFVCPYHQWAYELDGRLAKARAMPADLDTSELGLGVAHCATAGGLVFVCVAADAPDFTPVARLIESYLAPFDLTDARVAFETTMVERGNWKLVLENNRECYHCRVAHPELSVSFPPNQLHSGGGSDEERKALDDLVDRCEANGLPSRFLASEDAQYRAMRMPFAGGAQSLTMDGRPAVGTRFSGLPAFDLGDLLLYHYPSTWNHFVADHAVTFRVLPLGPDATEVRTTWLVPGSVEEGRDYDPDHLTAVWQATNHQDRTLVERAQRGVRSPAYRPGPYAPGDEDGVLGFVDWYAATMTARLTAAANVA